MHRYISMILILAAFLTFFPSCTSPQKFGNLELPVLDDPVKYQLEKTYYAETGKHLDWYTEASHSGLSGARYYGKYGYFYVWLVVNDTSCPMEIEIAGYPFSSIHSFALFACNGIHLYSLDFLYNDLTLISEEDLATITSVHQAYESRIKLCAEELNNMDSSEISDGGIVMLPVLSDRRKAELQDAHQKAFGYTPDWNNQNSSACRYYGTYNGSDIFFQSTMLTAVSEQVIAGKSFTHNCSFLLYAFRNDEWKSLDDAYDYGWVSKESIAIIAKIHEKYEKQAWKQQ